MGDKYRRIMPKGTPRDKSTKRSILHRLKIARGHLNKVIQMVEGDEYCIDVLHQSQAIQKALKHTDSLVLENHLKECAVDSIKNGKGEDAIKEVMELFKKV
jgi:CsoR family transcriptional regulator, copper-sensing transcriptional repressor